MARKYNQRMDASDRVVMTGWITERILRIINNRFLQKSDGDMQHKGAKQLAERILAEVITKFRPDLVGPPKQTTAEEAFEEVYDHLFRIHDQDFIVHDPEKEWSLELLEDIAQSVEKVKKRPKTLVKIPIS